MLKDRHHGQREYNTPLGALTFGETERIWRAEVEPLLPAFTCMNFIPGRPRAAAASPWAPNEMSHLDS